MKESIQNRENTLKEISEALHGLVGAQKIELGSIEAQIPDPDSINLFEWYKKDGRFTHTYHAAMGYALIPGLNSVGDRNLAGNFAGVTFENIAFIVCALKEKSNGITVLSPRRTNELFKHLYPNARRFDFPFREDSLGGDISIPDGIGIDESDLTGNTISNIYEFTLSRTEKVFDGKYDFFRKKKRNFPKLFSNTSLVFVLPKSATLPNGNGSDIRFIETNFTRSDFNDFMFDICCNYRAGDNIATLEEIEGWRKTPPLGDLANSRVDRTTKYFLAGMK